MKSLGASALILATVLTVAQWDAWLGVVGAVVLVLATAEVLLPTRYRLDASGITVERPFSRHAEPWSRFVGARSIREGFLLQGRGSRPALRRHRSRVLRCPAERDRVRAALEHHLEAECVR